jgi:hypothetical protein
MMEDSAAASAIPPASPSASPASVRRSGEILPMLPSVLVAALGGALSPLLLLLSLIFRL